MKTLNLFLFILFVNSLFAQNDQYMYSKEVTRAIDLREKQNEPLMASGNELTKFLIEATKEGRLTAYSSDSLRTQDKLTINTFLDNITLYVNEEDCFCDDFCDCDDSSSTSSTEYYFPRDLYQIEITEDVLFDKKRSTMVIQTKSLALFIPADHPDNMRGIQELVAVYDFDELNLLWNNTPEAVWINPHNDQEHKNLSDAFELRLFSSYIIKVSNPNDEFIADIHTDPYTALIESQNEAAKMAELESNLWEN